MEVIIGKDYLHFKGTIYKVLTVANDCETLEKVVVYYDKNIPTKVWVRKYNEFTSDVDKVKYPNIQQVKRFELLNDN